MHRRRRSVGWKGYDYCDPLRHSGKVDRVRLNADGTLAVVRFDLLSNQYGAKYWHDRTISRLAYDHFVHPGTLYTGANHGVSILFPAKYREPRPGEWFDFAYSEYMGDHHHARVCYHEVCGPDGESASMRVGDWLGLAIDGEGRLWHAGKWTAGRITWVDDAAAVAQAFRRRVRQVVRRSLDRRRGHEPAGLRGRRLRRPGPPHRGDGLP